MSSNKDVVADKIPVLLGAGVDGGRSEQLTLWHHCRHMYSYGIPLEHDVPREIMHFGNIENPFDSRSTLAT